MKIAVIQELPVADDLKANLQLGLDYCRKAVELFNPDLILFPEMWSNGFTMCPIESGLSQMWQSNAIDKDHPFIQAFKQEAITLSTNIAITYLEKNSKNELLNSVSILDNNGNEVLHYSKTQICNFGLDELEKDTPDINEIGCDYILSKGGNYDVCEIETDIGKVKVGAMICADREFPEVSTKLFNLGAEIIIVPNSCTWDKIRDQQFRARAFEILGGVVLANYPEPKNNGLSCAYDCVVWDDEGNGVDNTVLSATGNPAILLAEFDMEKIREFRKQEKWRVEHKLAFAC